MGKQVLAAQAPDARSPFPTRRELRAQEHRCKRAKTSVLGGATRTAILLSLAVTTVAIPATGFVGPENSLSLPTKLVVATHPQDSWAQGGVPTAERAEALDRVATAASRLRVRTPLKVLTCQHLESANGDRPITEQKVVMWPMQDGTFSFASPFGMRFHPILGTTRLHAGVDLAGPMGTPIYAAADGVVVNSEATSGYGYWIRIKHQYASGEVYYTGYAHMYPEQAWVEVGQEVSAGEQIAEVGSNGYSTGPHLHFEVHDANDTPIDPIPWLSEQNALQPGDSCQ